MPAEPQHKCGSVISVKENPILVNMSKHLIAAGDDYLWMWYNMTAQDGFQITSSGAEVTGATIYVWAYYYS